MPKGVPAPLAIFIAVVVIFLFLLISINFHNTNVLHIPNQSEVETEELNEWHEDVMEQQGINITMWNGAMIVLIVIMVAYGFWYLFKKVTL